MRSIFKGFYLTVVLAASAGVVSCSDDSPWSGSSDQGGINLNLSADGRVMRATRADDNQSPVVPDGSAFAIELTKSDGTYSKSWANVDGFNRETSFPIGDYSIVASYGDLSVQGFGNPCYIGSASVHVAPGALTEASVVATLANSMVSVRYTDKFTENFGAYSASVRSDEKDPVVFAQTEDRPAYVAPGNVVLNLTLTNKKGEQVTISPASFEALARHHYIVTVDATGNVTTGDLALNVVFEEEVVFEKVDVSLGDDLFNAPEPTVALKGVENGNSLEVIEGAAYANPVEFHVFAFGGLKQANLRINSSSYTPAFGNAVQLVGASGDIQSKLAASGLKCSGFFRNVDKMGVVDLSTFIKTLPAGTHSVDLDAVDMLTRVCEPVSIEITVIPVEAEFSLASSVDFLDTEVSVALATNAKGLRDEVKFYAPDENNRMVEATIKSVTESSATRSDLPYKFTYLLEVAPVTSGTIDIRASFSGKEIELNEQVNVPSFSLVSDAFSNYVVVKVDAEDTQFVETLSDKLVFYNGDTQIPTANVTRQGSGYIKIVGLQPSTTYHNINGRLGSLRKDVPEFTTEAATALTNGDFSASTQTINIGSIDTGGKFKVKVAFFDRDYQLKSSIVRSTPDNWATLNDFTCWTGSSNKNTWFLVPSTFSDNNSVVIRSVGYSHAGTTPATSGGSGNQNYYCENAPSSLDKASGELFLGSYSYDGSESRVDGVAWTTRPASLDFDYSYTSYNNEEGEAYVKILSASGDVLVQKTVYITAAENGHQSVSLSGYPFGVKAAKIVLGFKSTKSGVTPDVKIPTGSELKESSITATNFTNPPAIQANSYKAVAVGSELKVSNVSLGYGNSNVYRYRRAK